MNINIFDRKTSYQDALIKNGVYSLDKITIEATTTEDIYGNYELNISLEIAEGVPTELYEMVQVDNIIKVKDEYTEEIFRIASIEKGLDEINLYCRHITIADSLNLWLDNVRPTDANGQTALAHLMANTRPKCKLILNSNINKINTANYVRKNLYEALFDGDNSFITKWGGEVQRSGYTISINDKIGVDKSKEIIVKEALNLTEFNAKTNIDNVTTVIYPIGFDGIQADRVESPYVNDYSMEFPQKIKYEEVKVKKTNTETGEVEQDGLTEDEAKAKLRELAQKEFTDNKIDLLQFECDIDYVELSKYNEYKSLAQVQRTNLGDIISVRVDTFNIDLKARVVSRTYDVLRQRRIENTISTNGKLEKPKDIKDIIKEVVGDETIDIDKIFQDLGPHIDGMIQQGMKDSYVVVQKDMIFAMDNKDKNLAKKVIVLNKNGLGFSNNGIQGPFEYGFTIDGSINASMITSGLLAGQYIKGGTIEAEKLSIGAKQELRDGLATTSKVTQLEANIDGVNIKVSNTIDGGNPNLLQNGVLMGVTKPIGWTLSDGLFWDKYNDRNAGIYPNELGQTERFLNSELIPRPQDGIVSISAKLTAEANTYGAQIYIIGSRNKSYSVDWAQETMNWASGEYAQKSSPNIYIPDWVKYIWVRVDHEGKKSHEGGYYVYIDWINLVNNKYSFNDYGLFNNGINSKLSNLVVEDDKISARVEEINKDKDAKFSSLEITTNGIKTQVGSVENNLNTLKGNVTSLEQSTNAFKFDISNRGIANLIRCASGLKAYQTNDWGTRRYATELWPKWSVIDPNTNQWAYPDPNVYTFQLCIADGWRLGGGDMGIIQHNVKVQKGVQYTFSCYVASHRANDVFCYVRGKEGSSDYELIGSWAGTPPTGGTDKNNWKFIQVPFIAQKDHVHIEIGMRNLTDEDPYVWFAKPMLNVGKMFVEYTDNDREIYNGITKIDLNGIRCDFENGTYAEMGRDGFKYKHANWTHPYQYITKVLKVAKKRNGYWHTFQLGDEFKGKNIDQDFKLTHYIGAVDCNAYVETGQYGGALRTSFTEVRNWNSSAATIEARCCIQKITLKSEVMFGWDKATTDTHKGGIIGESAADIIIIAQM